MDLNTVSLVGNIGQNPELRYTSAGTAVTKLNLANKRWKKSADGKGEEVTSWFDVVVWGKMAENVCKFVGRGDRIAVSGHLEQETWEKEGQKRTAIKVISENIQFLTDKREKEQRQNFQPKPKEPYNPKNIKTRVDSYGTNQEPF